MQSKKRIIFILILCGICNIAYTQQKKGARYNLNSITGSPSATKININNVSSYINSNGQSDYSPTGDSGFQYPNGSGKTVFYASGPLWGGMIDNYWAVGGSAYRSGLLPGRILPDGTAENVNLPHVRIYRVRSDYKNCGSGDNMKKFFALEMADENKTAEEIYAQYELDWKEWPAQYGAPYIDKDNDGVYNPAKDIPGMSEVPCQTIWYVANDLSSSATQNLYGSLPMKIEMQATTWAYKTGGPEGNTIYKRYRLINRNSKKIDSMYLCIWSDPDLGGSKDDFTGCDTTFSLGYVYNGKGYDDIYKDTPPAAGYVLLQSPYLKGEAQDVAKYDKRILPGNNNIGMTAFFMHSNGFDANWSDPAQGDYLNGTLYFINKFKGRLARDGTPMIDRVTNRPTKYFCPGDPVNGTGWIDGNPFANNDRRMGLVSGPFTMNPNDTQQLVVAQVAAGGTGNVNYLNAVSMLKHYAASISYKWNQYIEPENPVSPVVSVSEMDQELILNWWETNSYENCEKDLNSVYKFQGYNVYQLPSAATTKNEGQIIKTYDLDDDKALIYDWVEDPVKGYLQYIVVGEGKNNGIKRNYRVTADILRNNLPLYNYSKYYFGVTAYYVANDPVAIPQFLESPLQVITVMPQPGKNGERLSNKADDELTVTHYRGISEANVKSIVIDPSKGNGHEYEISFTTENKTIYWNLKDLTGNELVLRNKKINENVITTGFQIQFLKNYSQKYDSTCKGINGTNWYYRSVFNMGSQGWNLNGEQWSGFLGNLIDNKLFPSKLSSYADLPEVELRFAQTDINGVFSPTDPNASFGCRFLIGAQNSAAKPEFIPFIKNNLNYGFQEFGTNRKPNIPLAAYNRRTGKRLALAFAENNAPNGTVDGIYFPPKGSNGGTDDPREILFILSDEYSVTTQPEIANFTTQLLSPNILQSLYFISASRYVDNFNSSDMLFINPYKVLTAEDKYRFTNAVKVYTTENAVEDISKINVFPNPYYGANPQELNGYQRFVTFTHLPNRARIRIFSISGQLIRTLNKEDAGQVMRWNLVTEGNLVVPSGIYVAHIELPDLGKVKILKFAVIQEQQYPLHY